MKPCFSTAGLIRTFNGICYEIISVHSRFCLASMTSYAMCLRKEGAILGSVLEEVTWVLEAGGQTRQAKGTVWAGAGSSVEECCVQLGGPEHQAILSEVQHEGCRKWTEATRVLLCSLNTPSL